MRKYWLYLSLLFILACVQKKEPLPAEFKNLIYKPGDCIAFMTDSGYYATAAIYDVKKDSNGLWYATCFLDITGSVPPTGAQVEKSGLSGRKVESDNGYIVGLDIEWLHESSIVLNREKTKKIGHFTFKPMPFMSEGKSEDYHRFLIAYILATRRRQSPPDDYRAYYHKTGADFRPEEYFPIKNFIIQSKK